MPDAAEHGGMGPVCNFEPGDGGSKKHLTAGVKDWATRETVHERARRIVERSQPGPMRRITRGLVPHSELYRLDDA